MTERVFGRTNHRFPSVWLSLRVPSERSDGHVATLAEAALASGLPLDVSSSPGLWGGAMRATGAVLMRVGGRELTHATDEEHAANLVRAHLIETLCAIGREHLDFYFLRLGDTPADHQIVGALSALEEARSEGHLRFLGLFTADHPSASLSVWGRYDAFEVGLTDPGSEPMSAALAAHATAKRAGLLIRHPSVAEAEREVASVAVNGDVCHLVPVSSPDEVRRAVALGGQR